MIRSIHKIAAVIALLTLSAFWTMTLGVELFGAETTIALVKRSIALGLFVLVPALAVTGGTGNAMAKNAKRGILGRKQKRTQYAAANGLLVLVPCALALWRLSASGNYGPLFYAIQGLELVAGIINIRLLGLNARDGYKLGSAWRRAGKRL